MWALVLPVLSSVWLPVRLPRISLAKIARQLIVRRIGATCVLALVATEASAHMTAPSNHTTVHADIAGCSLVGLDHSSCVG